MVSTAKMKEEVTEGYRALQNQIVPLQTGLSNIQSDYGRSQTIFHNFQSQIEVSNQNLIANVDSLNSKLDTAHKNLQNQILTEQEALSNKVLDCSVQQNQLRDKVKDMENILNPIPRKIFAIEVKIEDLTRYFGLKFNKSGKAPLLFVILI